MKNHNAKISSKLVTKVTAKASTKVPSKVPTKAFLNSLGRRKVDDNLKFTKISSITSRSLIDTTKPASNTEVEKVKEVKEEFLDREKEELYNNVQNWKKRAGDLEMDLKAVEKAKDKLIKDKLHAEEDYKECAHVTGHLQEKVYRLEEEVKTLKSKSKLDEDEKNEAVKALKKKEEDLEAEGIPKCKVCSRRLLNVNTLKGQMDIYYSNRVMEVLDRVINHEKIEESKLVEDNDMEHSDLSGYEHVVVQCKKCDKTLRNKNELRLHMKTHVKIDQTVMKCHYCEHETNNEIDHVNHIVDIHSTWHKCQTCGENFNKKEDLVDHIEKKHSMKRRVNFQTEPQPNMVRESPSPNVVQGTNTQVCFDCGNGFTNKHELINHKKQLHFKLKLCPHYHGSGRGCRFPDNVCYNIHKAEESQQQGQEQRGQTSVSADSARANIPCRDGEECVYYQQGSCRYKHSDASNQQQNPSVWGNNQQPNNNPNELPINPQSTNNQPTHNQQNIFNMNQIRQTLQTLVNQLIPSVNSLQDFPLLQGSNHTTV